MIWIILYVVFVVLAFFVFAGLNPRNPNLIVGAIFWPIPLLWMIFVLCWILAAGSWKKPK